MYYSIEKEIVLSECTLAIKKYDLVSLLQNKFGSLALSEKEKAIAGLIQLGEALTFCRQLSYTHPELASQAKICAQIRNNLIHHWMYDHKQDELIQNIKCINLEKIKEGLDGLEKNTSIQILSKISGTANNNFSFQFSSYTKFLAREMSALLKYVESRAEEVITSENESFIKNHVRNIFTILLDLVDEKGCNQNLNDSCDLEKSLVKQFNEDFQIANNAFIPLFSRLKANRNSLSHLVSDNPLQLENYQLFEFANDLIKMNTLGYVTQLETFLEKSINKEKRHADQPSVSKRRNSGALELLGLSFLFTPNKESRLPLPNLRDNGTFNNTENLINSSFELNNLTPLIAHTTEMKNETTIESKRKISAVDYSDSSDEEPMNPSCFGGFLKKG